MEIQKLKEELLKELNLEHLEMSDEDFISLFRKLDLLPEEALTESNIRKAISTVTDSQLILESTKSFSSSDISNILKQIQDKLKGKA